MSVFRMGWTGSGGGATMEGKAMSHEHPSRQELEDFLLGRLSQRDSRRVILHLLPGCSACGEVTADLWRAAAGQASWRSASRRFDYDRVVDRVIGRVRQASDALEADRAAARRHVAELEALPRSRRRARLEGDPRFHTWGCAELLIWRSEELGGSAEASEADSEAESLAGLALLAAGRLAPADFPPGLVEELRARAWLALGEARRLASDLPAAEEALRLARTHLLRGSGDRIERARHLEREALLRRDQGRAGDAARLLGRAILIYRREGQDELLAEALLKLGCVRAEAGREPGLLRRLLVSALSLRSRLRAGR